MSAVFLPLDVMWFELRRSLTVGRALMWFLMVAFPVGIIATMRYIQYQSIQGMPDASDMLEREQVAEAMGFTVYFLIPEVCCLLGLLLWATPAISTEVEGQTWVYLTMRPTGRRSVLLGKYLTAVVWTLSAAIVSSSICCLILGTSYSWDLWQVLCILSVLSCISHAALYVLIGSWFYRRTMVAAVAYTLAVEYGVSFIPALINKFTFNYRLRGLLTDWMQYDNVRSRAIEIFGYEPAGTHIAILLGASAVMLGVAVYRVERAEFPTQQEG